MYTGTLSALSYQSGTIVKESILISPIMPSLRSLSPRIVLTVAIMAAGLVNGILGEVVPIVLRPHGIVWNRLFADVIITAIAALTPLIFVFIACRQSTITRLQTQTIAGIALITGIIGRYVGTVIGSLLVGTGFPSPLILATRADLSIGLDTPIILLIVMLSVIVTGFWPVVGAFGGIGLTQLESRST